jgi:hypothetical protein
MIISDSYYCHILDVWYDRRYILYSLHTLLA